MGLLKNIFMCSISLGSIGLLIYWLTLMFSLSGAVEQKVITNSETDYLHSHAELMKSYMNLSVTPCDDFYEYACGNYRPTTPDRFSRRDHLSDIGYSLDDISEELVHLAESLNVSRELRVAQRLYNACLGANLSVFPAADPNYLKLIRSIGGFPVVDGAAWNASNFNWFNMSSHLTNYGARGLVHDTLRSDLPHKTYFFMGDLGFDPIVQADNIDTNSSLAYKLNEQRMRGYLRAFNLTEDKIAEVIEGIFAFWREALEAFKKDGSCDDNYFDVSSFFEIVTAKKLKDPWVCNPPFVEIEKLSGRHSEAIANYLAMQLLYTFDVNPEEIKNRKDYCTTTVRSSMWFLFKKLFLAEYFTEEKRLEVSQIEREMRNSLRKLLREADWLDSTARQEALLRESQILPGIESIDDPFLSTDHTDLLVQEILRLEFMKPAVEDGALRQAFEAYHNYLLGKDPPRSGTSEEMPGLDLSPDQLFFLGFAQMIRSGYKEDEQAFARNRVLNDLSNSEDFFRAFNCPLGSGMRPANKTYHVW
ncbi:neprilysin-1-like [Drosophila takahashii]|uniref:neprilysin-1-like n=1 Tax=Drosophila takahashii TaxID=29030 RepID=UPI0038990807